MYNWIFEFLKIVLDLTKFLIIISDPTSTAKWSAVLAKLSWTLEFMLTFTLINDNTVSISEFKTAFIKKFLPLLSVF